MEEDRETFDLKHIRFALGFVCHGMVNPISVASFMVSFRDLAAAGIQIDLVPQIGSSIIDFARNDTAREFLKTPAQKLIFIDTDMEWVPDELARLMCWSTKYPLVAALYPTKTDVNPKYKFLISSNEPVVENEYGLVPMEGVSTGFSIIDRSVFETMMPQTEVYWGGSPKEDTYRFFKTDVLNKDPIGEDIYFFNRWVKEFGGEIWVDPDINPGHVGLKVYKSNLRNTLVTYNEKVNQAAQSS